MDDMKKLIEKYKQELMAYRKAAEPRPAPSEPTASVPAEAAPRTAFSYYPEGETASAPENRREKPQIIGYSDEGDINELYKGIFGDSAVTDEEPNAAQSGEAEESADSDDISVGEEPPAADEGEAAENIFDFTENPSETTDEDALIERPEEMFSPLYNEIPPFGDVKSEITEESRPENNPLPPEPVSGVTSSAPTAPLPEAAQAQRVSPETAERLTEQPVSGTDPDEQLTGRSFEAEERPVNDPADIKPNGNGAPAVNYEERTYSSYAEFESANTRAGQLRFRTFTARGALPVKDAVCIVTKDFNGQTLVISSQTTDMSGQTEIISLPAPPRSLSQTPNSTVLPYALYDATISAKGFEKIVLKNIPIFEGILSVQNAALIPLAPESSADNIGETIDEAVTSGGE